MSYQVLARKWRPKRFSEMVGQEHVLRAMINALDQGRLHHAYLFTGTRGVGKTTIARILAKSLNCDSGITSQPCGQCSACKEIDEGRFVDLIEVDAASRTKVEDTRELLENVQYAPTRGRYKVYLIDEVHMLSGHSFNALLKTLEEPPLHVKFLLATTDPQKLPVTILSRCLQFSLKAMPPEKIVQHLQHVLAAESVVFEEPALWSLARAAQGSMRDAMSLTDQAIAFGAGSVRQADVSAMLGTIDRDWVWRLLEPLVARDTPAMFSALRGLDEHSPDYAGVLADMLACLHRVAVAQLHAEAVDNSEGDRDRILALAKGLTPEDAQLLYQIGLMGRRDLPLAPEPRAGFEMVLMRMLMFRPVVPGEPPRSTSGGASRTFDAPGRASVPPASAPRGAPVASASTLSAVAASAAVMPAAAPSQARAALAASPATALRVDDAPVEATMSVVHAADNVVSLEQRRRDTDVSVSLVDRWIGMVDTLGLSGPALNFARSCVLESDVGNLWLFLLAPRHESTFQDAHVKRLEEALKRSVSDTLRIKVEVREPTGESPHARSERLRRERDTAADRAFRDDPFVKALQQEFGAVLEAHTIKPVS